MPRGPMKEAPPDRSAPLAQWKDMADLQLTRIAEWRQAHPRATWDELETAVDAEFAVLRRQVLEDAAMSSPAVNFATERPTCPQCGRPMHAAGAQPRRLTTDHNQLITLTRTYARCPACQTGLFPPG